LDKSGNIKINRLDQIFQDAVDFEVGKLYNSSINEVLNLADYGSIDSMTQRVKINIGWWKYKFDENLYHVLFKCSRKLFLGFYRNYLSGIKIDNGNIEYLSAEELGSYD
jgi:hypothetical protein